MRAHFLEMRAFRNPAQQGPGRPLWLAEYTRHVPQCTDAMFMARGIPSVEVHLGSSLPAAAATADVDGDMEAEYDNAPGNGDGHDHATPEAGVELD